MCTPLLTSGESAGICSPPYGVQEGRQGFPESTSVQSVPINSSQPCCGGVMYNSLHLRRHCYRLPKGKSNKGPAIYEPVSCRCFYIVTLQVPCQAPERSCVLQIEQQLWLARQQIESMLSAAGREGASALRELEGRLRGISDLDLLAWEHWWET